MSLLDDPRKRAKALPVRRASTVDFEIEDVVPFGVDTGSALGNRAREPRVAAKVISMTLHGKGYEVGVRELHDRLSEHLERVERGAEIMVTRRGQPIARLSAVDGEDPLEDLVRRGLITPPARARTARRARVHSRSSVSDLVTQQRR
jgi:prevent-host-death family protein